MPPSWAAFDSKNLELLAGRRERSPDKWWLVTEGPECGSGPSGNPVNADRAQRILTMLRATPLTVAIVKQAGFYDDAGFCVECAELSGAQPSPPPTERLIRPPQQYCYDHWHVSSTGYGTCPFGHGKSLDPHWSPE
jgi:hypothetical protein